MKKKIYIKQWLELKPYEKQTVTDIYYLDICNVVKRILIKKYLQILLKYFDLEEVSLLSCLLTSYFEDIISETHIWTSFVKKHESLYNKKLPFYNTDEYYDNEINIQDVQFLIWYFFNTIQMEKFVHSNNYLFFDIASDIMEVFENAYEYAPENKYLKSFYQINENEKDFYIARNLIDTVLFKTYLFYTDTYLRLREDADKIIKNNEKREFLIHSINEIRVITLHTNYTRLLSLKGQEWVANILGENHPLSLDFLNMSKVIRGFFLYKGQDKNNVFIEHIASSKKFNLTKKSFDNYESLIEIDSILFLGIVLWQGEWWFSGLYYNIEFDPDLILDEKNSIESRMAVNFLEDKKEEIDDVVELQLKAFLDFNNGSQIVFLPSKKIDNFILKYNDFYNKSLNISKKEEEEAESRAKKDGFFGTNNDEKFNLSEISESGLVFMNPKSGIEIAMSINSAFPLPENPFFKKENSQKNIMDLFFSENLSTELAMYCVDNCKTKLPFLQKGAGKMFLEDIDFLLRFWKKNSYHTIPIVATTGKKKV